MNALEFALSASDLTEAEKSRLRHQVFEAYTPATEQETRDYVTCFLAMPEAEQQRLLDMPLFGPVLKALLPFVELELS